MDPNWKLIPLEDSNSKLLVIAKFHDCGYTISWLELSDGCPQNNVGWIQECSLEDFDVYSKLYNPRIEGSRNVLLSRLKRSTTDDTQKTKFHVSGFSNSEERTLVLTSPLGESSSLHFTWRYECNKMDGDKYCDHFLRPLFKLASIFSQQCNLLVKNIIQKDREIDEHKANGSILKRSHLETQIFDERTFVTSSLKEPSIVSCMSSPVTSLLDSSWTQPALTLVYTENETEIPKPLPVRQRSPKKTQLAANEIHSEEITIAHKSSENEKPSIEEEEEQEKKRRKKLEQLKASSGPRKKKQKSVF